MGIGLVIFLVKVVARDHFQTDEVTVYRFTIDKHSWLPSAVEEFTLPGVAKRIIRFRDTRINLGIEERFFRLDGS